MIFYFIFFVEWGCDFHAIVVAFVERHEVVGEVVGVGSEVTKFKAGDRVGVGCLVGCCRSCGPCNANVEQYCNKRIWSYNDVYYDGRPTMGGFAEAMVVDQK